MYVPGIFGGFMSNSLINEKSPYLLEHAENPVDWYPWGEAAFAKARREDKPVFLSIGYSTCHWCHVMARESFEDKRVADILNKYYISVKVDREERPDVDAVYMRACTALNGSGGWPLTVIMTPEQKPFFVTTYLPRESRNGTLGLMELLTAVAAKWNNDRAALLKTSGDIYNYLSAAPKLAPEAPSADFATRAKAQLAELFDSEYAGFGRAPKFPTPHNLIFLMRFSALTGDKDARRMVDDTLKAMYRGGIYDHLGGGFSRYSTDREWLAPHFEKTLYDNALLAYAYTEAWQSGHLALYRNVAEATLDYCMRELLSSEGGYYCGQDADSNGVEGAYYLLTPTEVAAVLGEDAGRGFCECYDITAEGNFHGASIPNLLINNRWTLLPEGYDDFREKLRLYRERRMELRCDNKILTAWNGLMLMALSRAARVFSDRRYLSAAKELAAFMERRLFMGGALKARLCAGELRFDAQLDDYVFYALGLLELYAVDYQPTHILRAQELARSLLAHFAGESGEFYRTADTAEALITRPIEFVDSAIPSGNSGAAVLFDLLFRLTGDIDMREARDKLLAYICAATKSAPAASPFALCALLSAAYPTRELLCAAPDEAVPELLKTVTSAYSPETAVILKSPAREKLLAKAAPFTEAAQAKGGKAVFYVCSGGVCREEIGG